MEGAVPPAATADPILSDVDDLLVAITLDGFTLRYCNGFPEPSVIVATYDWGSWADIVVIRAIDDVISARIPIVPGTDIFAPTTVVWMYEGDAVQALHAMFELHHPDHPQAPTTATPAPGRLRIPAARQAPVTVRPPSARVARTRQIRLSAAILVDTANKDTEVGVLR